MSWCQKLFPRVWGTGISDAIFIFIDMTNETYMQYYNLVLWGSYNWYRIFYKLQLVNNLYKL